MICIGIIGGGQLGMMTIEAKYHSLPVEFAVLEESKDCPSFELARHFIQGKITSEAAIRKLSKISDVLTWEIEHVNVDTLIALQKEGKLIIPQPAVLKIIQDKGIQKGFFKSNGIPTAAYILCESTEINAEKLLHFPGDFVVVKARKGGYDGKGVTIIEKSRVQKECPFKGSVLIESFIADAMEIAIIVAIAQDGSHAIYPSIEMYFNPTSNLVEFLFSPSRISIELEKKAQKIALHCIEALHSPGLFAVELFITKEEEILVNEVAPRPHNSGHHTIEGCECSQFEQFIRILAGAPLGDTRLIHPAAMLNIVGPASISGPYFLENELALNNRPDTFIHMYRKSETRPNRKLGHATVIATNREELLIKAGKLKGKLTVIAKDH